MKLCPKCDRTLDLSSFSKDRSTASGLSAWCRDCTRAKNAKRYEEDKERRLAKQKAYHQENREVILERFKQRYQSMPDVYKAEAQQWADNNRDKVRAKAQRYYRSKPEYFLEKSRRRQLLVAQQTPAWVDLEKVRAIYAEARRLTESTGIPHEVDHVIPIKGRNVCGLHWEGNLEIKTQEANRRKYNKMDDKA